MKVLALTVVAGCLLGCTTDKVGLYHSDYDPLTRSYWTNIKSAMDTVGGERTELLCRSDRDGRVQRCWDSHGPGMLQGFMAGGFAGMAEAAGVTTGMALLRPATTTISNGVSNGGASIGAGAVTASSSPVNTASPQVTASANPVNTASPQVSTKAVGRGGAGGTGGAGGQGGQSSSNAASSPVVTASPVITANPVASNAVTATGGASNATGGAADAAAAARARSNQNQGQTQNQGQWNCIASPPCN